MDWNQIWTDIKNFFIDNVWNIVRFFAILLIGLIVIKIILNIFKRFMSRTRMERIAQSFLYHVMKFLLYLVLVLILLSTMGIAISGMLTAISAVLLAVGMALESNIANFANGIVIVCSKMFKKGDFIDVNGTSGSIEDINFLFTTITTVDNKRVTIPNSTLVNNAVTNFGANKVRRVDFTFGVAYDSDVELVKKIILDVINSNGKVRLDKAPFCRLRTLNASSIDFFANCWVDKEDYWEVYYYVIENVFNEFKRNNVSIPYNQIEIRDRHDVVNMPVIGDGLPKRVEKERKQTKSFDLENDDIIEVIKAESKERHEKIKAQRQARKSKNKANKKQIAEVEKIPADNNQKDA